MRLKTALSAADPAGVMKLIPILLVSLVFLGIGLRLFRSGARGEGQERWLSVFFLGMACGLPMRMAAVEIQLASGSGGEMLNALGHAALSLTTIAILFFVWRVFRPDDVWARAVVYAFSAFQIALIPALVWLGGLRDETGGIVVVANVSRSLPLFWALFESLRYRGLMSRRVELGLADPVVANRFTLFSLWTGSLAVLPTVVVAIRLYLRGTGLDEAAVIAENPVGWIMPLIRIVLVSGGLTAAVAIWLSFFPPRFYIARLEAGGQP